MNKEISTPPARPAKPAKLAKGLKRGTEVFGQPGAARFRSRHMLILASFLIWIVLPLSVSGWYLWTIAADKYTSYVGFLVRSEQMSAGAADGLGGIMDMVQTSSKETDILYKFIQSRSLVDKVNATLDLRSLWSKEPQDFVFSYRSGSAPEDLVKYWNRNVKIYYDQGMLDLRVLAFEPKDAQAIAQAILKESQELINQLNAGARSDTLLYAKTDLEVALNRLKEARANIQAFRSQNRIIDPLAYVTAQEGVLTSLQQQLAEALIQYGVLEANSQQGDPRVSQAELRIGVIREQIDAERSKIGNVENDTQSTTDIVTQYEALEVDRLYAENAYSAALASYDMARAQADRQTLYLAQYVHPTLAGQAEHPQRIRLMLLVAGFFSLTWLMGIMTYYSIRDRR